MFRDARSLAEIYPALVRHAMEPFQAPDVMKFFNRKRRKNTDAARRKSPAC